MQLAFERERNWRIKLTMKISVVDFHVQHKTKQKLSTNLSTKCFKLQIYLLTEAGIPPMFGFE